MTSGWDVGPSAAAWGSCSKSPAQTRTATHPPAPNHTPPSHASPDRTAPLHCTAFVPQVPKVYWQYSSPEVLVLEYCPGVKINDAKAIDAMGLDRNRLARLAVESYLQQILRYGFFHVRGVEKGVLKGRDCGNDGLQAEGWWVCLQQILRYSFFHVSGRLEPSRDWVGGAEGGGGATGGGGRACLQQILRYGFFHVSGMSRTCSPPCAMAGGVGPLRELAWHVDGPESDQGV